MIFKIVKKRTIQIIANKIFKKIKLIDINNKNDNNNFHDIANDNIIQSIKRNNRFKNFKTFNIKTSTRNIQSTKILNKKFSKQKIIIEIFISIKNFKTNYNCVVFFNNYIKKLVFAFYRKSKKIEFITYF